MSDSAKLDKILEALASVGKRCLHPSRALARAARAARISIFAFIHSLLPYHQSRYFGIKSRGHHLSSCCIWKQCHDWCCIWKQWRRSPLRRRCSLCSHCTYSSFNFKFQLMMLSLPSVFHRSLQPPNPSTTQASGIRQHL
jgi:hypothetical protein